MAAEPLMHSYPLALNIISYCWMLFAVIWLLAAFWTKRSVYRESRAQRLRYVIPILLGGFLLAKGHRLSDPLNHRVIPHIEALASTGAVLCIVGLAFCIWARFTLGRNWSGVVTLKGGHELITNGPLCLGASSNLHRITDHVRGDRDRARPRRRNNRYAVRVREPLDKIAPRRKAHVNKISERVCGLSAAREAPHSVHPLKLQVTQLEHLASDSS